MIRFMTPTKGRPTRERSCLPELDFPPVGTGDLYEVINGQIVEPPPMGLTEAWIASCS